MRTSFFAILILILGLISCNHDNKSKFDENQRFKEITGMSKEELTPKEVDDLSDFFDAELLQKFIQEFRNRQYTQIYSMLTNDAKELQTQDDIVKYYQFMDNLYGDIVKIEPKTFAVNKQLNTSNTIASANYDIFYKNCKGVLQTSFEVVNKDSILLQAMRINIDKGYQFEFFSDLTRPFFSALTRQDFPVIYKMTSQKLQDYTPITKYEEFMNKLKDVEVDTTLSIHRIGIVENKILFYLWYPTDFQEKDLKLTYVESDKGYKIEGINLE